MQKAIPIPKPEATCAAKWTDPVAWSMAAPRAIEVRDAVLARLSISIDVFRPISTGGLRRAKQCVHDRELVWMAMRDIQVKGISPLSFPEIADATGTTHTTVLTAVHRCRRREAKP